MNTAADNIQNSMQVLNIPIEDIIPNRFQPRLAFDETGLKELAASIKEHGIIQPLVLRRLQDKYEIIAGERRYKAAKMAGLMSVPAIISDMDDRKSAEVAIVENVQRRDLSSIEEAKSYKTLLDKGYLTQEELAKKMGLSQSAIANKLRLLSLSPSVQEALINGKISERHARSLLVLDDLKEQDEWLQKLINERLTVKELDKRLKKYKDSERDEDIPIIDVNPNIDAIRENAMDIISDKNNNINNNNSVTLDNKIPNTFFNFLENEAVNMNSLDIASDNPVVSDINDVNNTNNEEEIELLDFLVPNQIVNSEIKNMDVANDLVNSLINALKENDYTSNLQKEENDKEIKYTIIINSRFTTFYIIINVCFILIICEFSRYGILNNSYNICRCFIPIIF